jgi:hypothetical protein
MVETYLQSLNPEQFPEQRIIDDAYFLRQVALDQDRPASPITQTFVVGGSARDQVVRTTTGWPWPLYPEGYVGMFFVDRTDFDPDHYNLQHEGTESLDGFEYHRFAVTPKKENSVGRFTGQIWVDPKDFHIARLKGVFTTARLSLNPRHLSLRALRELGINFHFDSWRDRTGPGYGCPPIPIAKRRAPTLHLVFALGSLPGTQLGMGLCAGGSRRFSAARQRHPRMARKIATARLFWSG